MEPGLALLEGQGRVLSGLQFRVVAGQTLGPRLSEGTEEIPKRLSFKDGLGDVAS